MKVSWYVAALAALGASSAAAAPIQWTGAGANGHYYELIIGNGQNLRAPQAEAAAEARSFQGVQGHLATITSAEELAFINTLVGANRSFWIGASDRDEEGVFRWIAGPEAGQLLSTSFENFAAGEPNQYRGRNEDYVEANWRGRQWNDEMGSRSRGYLVEYSLPPVPLPAGLPMLLGALGLTALLRRRARG